MFVIYFVQVREVSVPNPGTDKELMKLVSNISSSAVDEGRPLWICYLINHNDDQYLLLKYVSFLILLCLYSLL